MLDRGRIETRAGRGRCAWWRGLLVLCLLLASATLLAAPRTLRFSQLGVDDGLPQESVIAVAQDAQGFMWFGTQTGLARFDGYRFTVYRHDRDDPCSIADNWVQSLLLDRDGALWVGTRAGLDRFDPQRGCFEPLALDGLPEQSRGVHAMLLDPQRRLWLSTMHGLVQVDAVERRMLRLFREGGAGGLSSNTVGALAMDPAGSLWVRTPQGVDRLRAGEARFVHMSLATNDQPVVAMRYDAGAVTVDAAGALWVGTQVGLYRFRPDADGLSPLPLPAGMPAGASITSLLTDRGGTLWVATLQHGLLRLEPGADAFLQYLPEVGDRLSIGDRYVLSLFQDSGGTLWAGTWAAGVSRTDLDSGGFELYSQFGTGPMRLSDSRVYGVSSGGPGVLWLTTRGGGVNRFDIARGQVRSYRHVPGDPASLPVDATLVSLEDGAGGLWVASDRELGRIDLASGRYTPRPLRTGGIAPLVYALYRQPGDTRHLWVGTRGGLYRLDLIDDSMRVWRHAPADPASLGADFVVGLLQDRRGRLWLATVDGGLDLLDPDSGHVTHHRHDPDDPSSLNSNRVQALYEARNGTLWVGTAAGLNRLEETSDGRMRFRSFGSRDGLAADSIGSIQEDAEGRLWISSTAGLSRFDPRTWRVRNYGTSDGLPGGSYFVGSGLRDADGTLYFGGLNGLTAVGADGVRDNPVPPPVAITDFQVFNRSIQEGVPSGLTLDAAWPMTRRLTLGHDLSVFTIEFAALHFADPARNQYAYRLQGFDRDWVRTDAGRRFATYTNLDPGRYLFQVRASNKDGVWNEEGTTLEIVVLPPWWGTWWFRIGAVLLALAVVAGLYRRRTRQLRLQAQRLEQRVEERTHELELTRAGLEQASLTDPLTGMRNRRFLRQQLDADLALTVRGYSRAAAHGQPAPQDMDLILFLVDIDHFKRVNDEQGHAAGDEILVQVHDRLRAVLRSSDYLVRWGGEEFLVVARGTPRGTAAVVAEHIRRSFADAPFALADGTRLTKTCSIGFASLPFVPARPEALDWPKVVDVADIALYAAKAAGRNGWVGIEAAADADVAGWGSDLRSVAPALLASGALAFVTSLDRDRVATALGGVSQGAG